MQKFLNQLLGSIDIYSYAAGFVFALIGALISLLIHSKKRDKLSDKTPYKFSWWFLLRDNAQRLVTGFLITFVAFRFAPEILKQEFSMFYAFGIGLGFDQVIGLIAKWQKSARK